VSFRCGFTKSSNNATRLSRKKNTAEQWKDEQHVKSSLRDDKWYGMGTKVTKKPPLMVGVEAVKKGDKNPNDGPAIILLPRYCGRCPLSATPTAPFVKNGALLSSR
jgi:hypothetical protein